MVYMQSYCQVQRLHVQGKLINEGIIIIVIALYIYLQY